MSTYSIIVLISVGCLTGAMLYLLGFKNGRNSGFDDGKKCASDQSFDLGKRTGYTIGHDDGVKEGLAENNNHLSKDEVDMIRQVLNVMSWDGESHENKDKSK